MTQSILKRIQGNAHQHPDRLAFVTPVGQAVTYKKFQSTIEAFSSRLIAEGVKPGQTICVAVENPVVSITLWFALMHIGAIPCIAQNVNDPVSAGVPVDAFIGLADQTSMHAKRLTFSQDWFAAPDQLVPEAEPAGMIFGSSGSTGQSKFMRIQPMVMETRTMHLDRLNGPCNGTCLIAINTANAAAVRHIYRAVFATQGMLFVADSVADTLQLCAMHKARELVAPPRYFNDLLSEIEKSPERALALDRVEIGGSGASLQLFERGKAAFGCDVRFSYGSSELSTVAQGSPGQSNSFENGLVGLLQDWVKIRIIGDHGETLKPDETGEIHLQVPEAFRVESYYGANELFDYEGWFTPGDIGKLRTDGQLVIEGRKSEMINTGGTNILPEHIEAAVRSTMSFNQIAAFSVPGTEGFDHVGVAIVSDMPVDKRQVSRFLRKSFGESIVFHLKDLDQLPLTRSGKLDRKKLRDLI